MDRPKAYIETWGCQLNVHRSEGIGGHLCQAGYDLTKDLARADLIIFNTCAVRERAEEKVYGRIGQIQDDRKDGSLLGVGGCMVQYKGEDFVSEKQEVDFAFGTSNLREIPVLADEARNGQTAARVPFPNSIENMPAVRSSDHFAWVTIAEGCSNACSYCIVPRVRGPLRSRDPGSIMEEVKALVKDGYKEIQLLGQNVNAYGGDLPEEKETFAWLLDRVASKDLARVSFTTPHPKDIDGATLQIMKRYPNIVRHIHLPLQSGSDRVLKLMNRGYTRGQYLGLVERVRNIDPKINITTDLIVGHPGERSEDFAQTREIIERVKFGSIYAAKFSARPGTRSPELSPKVPEGEKQNRLQEVLSLQKSTLQTQEKKYIGETNQILVEDSARTDGYVRGKNEFKKTVLLPGSKDMIGEMIQATVQRAENGTLYARSEE